MMNKMMNAMIRSMSVEQRQEMMLKMMPEMMKKCDAKILLPNMLKETGKIISLYGVYNLISKIVNNTELKKSLSEKIDKAKEKFSKKLPEFFSVMAPFMKKLIPKMLSSMKPMMPHMMGIMKEDETISKIKPDVKEEMANCMQTMMPILRPKN